MKIINLPYKIPEKKDIIQQDKIMKVIKKGPALTEMEEVMVDISINPNRYERKLKKNRTRTRKRTWTTGALDLSWICSLGWAYYEREAIQTEGQVGEI